MVLRRAVADVVVDEAIHPCRPAFVVSEYKYRRICTEARNGLSV